MTYDDDLLKHALLGCDAVRAQILSTIKKGNKSESLFPFFGANRVTEALAAHPKHRISAAGRRRISQAQKRRWAAQRKQAKG